MTMTEKILEYRTVTSHEQARKIIKDFENKYHTHYDWGLSYGDIEEAIAVCLLETERGYRYVTTTKVMSYIERRRVVKTVEDIGEL
jgi:hypothetical protein